MTGSSDVVRVQISIVNFMSEQLICKIFIHGLKHNFKHESSKNLGFVKCKIFV